MDTDNIKLSNINKNEAIRYLGYKDSLPDVNMTKLILAAEEELLKVIIPRYIYKVFDLEFTNDSVSLVGSALDLPGKSIFEHLKGCEKAAIMCATLSGEVDKLLRKNELSNMVNALIIDALSNAAIEQVCDEVEKVILKDFDGYTATWRFGVGYGDLPLTQQKDLLNTIDAPKRIGVTATESMILTPRKSVTCIIGLSNTENVSKKKSCDTCNLKETCNFRKNGNSCGK